MNPTPLLARLYHSNYIWTIINHPGPPDAPCKGVVESSRHSLFLIPWFDSSSFEPLE